jgi:hypothetical protein
MEMVRGGVDPPARGEQLLGFTGLFLDLSEAGEGPIQGQVCLLESQ